MLRGQAWLGVLFVCLLGQTNNNHWAPRDEQEMSRKEGGVVL